MNISYVCVGELRENCYLVEKDDECLLVDPGDDLEKIYAFLEGKRVDYVLVTHNHFDHVASLDEIVRRNKCSVYDFYSLKEGSLKIGNFDIEVIFTPGHQSDCVCYYFKNEKVMFTGDFLFRGTIGRCDLPGGDIDMMWNSIEKIKKYDDDIVIYPGHGQITTLGDEKKYNPYF